MKTTLIYGFAMAFVGTLLACLLYFAGFHDSAEKMKSAQWIGLGLSLVNTVTCLTLGLRARRAEIPANEPFGYGRSLGNGTLISLWGAIFGALGHVLYMTVINRDFHETVVRGELAKMEERGMSSTQIEQAEGMVRAMTGPVGQGIVALIIGFVIAFVVALIVAAFVQRSESPAQSAG